MLNFDERYLFLKKLNEKGLMNDDLKKKIKTGCIIGAMYIEGCEQNNESGYRWSETRVYNLLLDSDKSILFDEYIEGAKGKLSVWEYDLPKKYYEKYPQLLEE